ncbi:MAG: SWIM zinc finger family protein, partial [Actinomycetota bacterium]
MAISNPELPALQTWSNLPGHEQIRALVGAPNVSRGTALARAGRVRWITTDVRRHLLYATVDDAGPNQVLVHAGDALGIRRSTGQCTCSRPGSCEHIAAVLIAALDDFGPGAPDTPPAWERALLGLSDEGRHESGAVPIGLQFEPVPGKPGTAHHLRIRLRPVIPGKKGWVRTGTSWRDMSFTWSHPDQTRAHREALHLLHQSHRPTTYSYGEPAVHLDEFGPALWPLLRDAADAGVPFVHARASAGAVALADEPAIAALDLARDELGTVTVTTVVDVPGSTDDAAPASFVGQPAHGVVLDLGAAPGPLGLLLAPLHKPLDRKASGVLSVGELRVPAEDVERFLAEYYPALRRVVEVRSSDGSVELPVVAPPRLGLRLTYADARSLSLEWSFLYEAGGRVRRVPLAGGTDPSRDRLAEQRLLRDLRLPDPLLAGPGVTGPAPMAELTGVIVALFTSETVPELEDQGVVVEVVGTPGEYRHSESVPVIRVSATDSADADWFDLGVTVEIDGEEVPFAR